MASTTFYRSVRSYPEPLPKDVIKIDPPPAQAQKTGGTSALLQLLYPLSGMLISGLFIFTSVMRGGNLYLIIGGICFIPLSVGIMFLANYIQRRSFKQKIKAERETYRRYLEGIERRIAEIGRRQRAWNTRLYPDLSNLVPLVEQQRFLWERRPADEDFLKVRVGLAPAPLCCSLEFQEDYRVNYEQELLFTARELTTSKQYLDKQPQVISLTRLGTLAIAGQSGPVRSLVRGMLSQIVTFHAPGEVRIVACYPQEASSAWKWLKWLPHTRRLRQLKAGQHADGEQLSMLADTVSDFEELYLNQLKPEIERRERMNLDRKNGGTSELRLLPHLVVVLDGFTPGGPLARMEGTEELLRNSTRLGITVLCLVSDVRQAPSMIQGLLSISARSGGTQLLFKETTIAGSEVEFILPDMIDTAPCEQIARFLAPLKLVDMDADFDFSQDIRLLDLQNIQAIEQYPIAKYWSSPSPQQLLRVPIGQHKNGPLLLDLKEMAMGGYGPHGLVVGATGSGKSELLRTIVSSLALTHDPQLVNFVLVDFKAGAAFADFENLPHVAGIITNLENDPLLITRMYESLLGEQNRRQMLLSRAGNLINIRQYQARRQKNRELEPMPYLLIIVDEFAQLIANHEEFLPLFTKFGQVGRSLGMHMMLATQRVDEGRIKTLEGHLRYRICLRTFRPEESASVLGTPDAYFLPPAPGSGYFKVDDDVYTAFKAALISTPYVAPDEQQVDPVTLIRKFTSTGRLVPVFETTAWTIEEEGAATEMTKVVECIQEITPPVGGWRVHPVWQPPLKDRLLLDELLLRCGHRELDGSHWPSSAPFGPLTIPIGLLDRPVVQVQEPVMLDFAGVGGHMVIIGVPQSGKSTLLRTLIASFMVTHSPQEVQLYCIDLGGGLLRVFDGAPHIGAVCSKTERDRIRRVIRRMRQVLLEREELFASRGIDSMATYRQLRKANKLENEEFGDIFLLIDNFGQFQSEFEMLDADIINEVTTLLANGLTYGIHLVLTSNQWIEIRPRLRNNIGTRLELRLNDPGDTDIDRKLALSIPRDIPGRGLLQTKLLFQTALPIVREKQAQGEPQLQAAVDGLIQRTRWAWEGAVAPQIMVLPPEVAWSELLAKATTNQPGVPIGLEEFRLGPQCIDLFQNDPHFLILGDRECGKTTCLRTWIRGLQHYHTSQQVQVILIDYRKTLLDMSRNAHVQTYAIMAEQVKEAIKQLKVELESRLAELSAQPVEQFSGVRAWNGTHYVLIVDDYEMVATPDPRSGNPLNPLEGLLQSAHEIGFHLVLARRVANFGQTNMDPIFRGLKNMEGPGLLMRGDPTEGRMVLHKQSITDALPRGRGTLVRRSYPPTLVQVAY
ncbi:MAG TPA: type VII secretion protein EccCa [Ktedonobacteraceae bacterium]|nr:type VII secretion protein EccCa [Ktedonobacteraceae bacterium]